MAETALYRGFRGFRPDGDVFDVCDPLPWDEARVWMLQRLVPFLVDVCDDCRQRGREALDGLVAAEPGPWEDDVDGDDYWIEADGPHVASYTLLRSSTVVFAHFEPGGLSTPTKEETTMAKLDDVQIPEDQGRRVLEAAVREGRSADLMICLMRGGAASIDQADHLILMHAAVLEKLIDPVDVPRDGGFTFDREEDGSLSRESAVFQALGAASSCWETLEGAGVFDSTRAKGIGEALLAELGCGAVPEGDGRRGRHRRLPGLRPFRRRPRRLVRRA